MAKQILLAGIVGGITLFIWGFVGHMVLPLGTAGVQNLPQDQAVVGTMKDSIASPGLYFFPPENPPGTIAADKIGGPHGILIYHPNGASPMMTGQLINEFILNVVQALIAAYLLSLAAGLAGYASRVGFVFVLGILVAITTNVQYWNWYGFPASYTIAQVADHVIGLLVVGLVAAAFVKPSTSRMVTLPAKAA